METSTIRKYGDIFVVLSVGCLVASGIGGRWPPCLKNYSAYSAGTMRTIPAE